jgi:hypothetical protein
MIMLLIGEVVIVVLSQMMKRVRMEVTTTDMRSYIS